jgi:WD40 repeat protein
LNTVDRNVDELRQEAAACLGDFVGLEPMVWSDFGDDYNRWAVALAISPNGKLVAIGTTAAQGSGAGLVLLRDIVTGSEVARLEGHHSGVFDIQFSPDGHRLVSADDMGVINVWTEDEVGGWTCSRTITTAPSEQRNFVRTVSLAITPNGKRLLGCSQGELAISMWDLDDGSLVGRFAGNAGEKLARVALSPDGKVVVGLERADRSSRLLVWDMKTAELLHTVPLDLDNPIDAVFGPDGRVLACTPAGGFEVLSSARFQRQLLVLGDAIYSAAFSPDGRLLAIPSHELNLIRLWDTRSNREVAVLDHSEDHPHAVAFSRDGTLLVSMAALTVRVWNLAGSGEKRILAGHAGGIHDMSFNADPNAPRLASASDDQTVRIWNAATGRLLHVLSGFQGPVHSVRFSPDGQLLATGDAGGRVQIWKASSLDTPALATTINAELGRDVSSIAFSPSGEYFGAAGNGGVGLWRVVHDSDGSISNAVGDRTKQVMSVSFELVARPSDSVAGSLTFSPKGNLVAWVDQSARVRVWDLRGSRPLSAPSTHANLPHDLTFDRDGTHLFLVSYPSGVLESWELVSGQQAGIFDLPSLRTEHTPFFGNMVALSPNGGWLSRPGSRTTVWDTRTRRPLVVLGEERSTPWCQAWSANQELLAIGSSNGELVIWDLPAVRSQLAKIGLDW